MDDVPGPPEAFSQLAQRLLTGGLTPQAWVTELDRQWRDYFAAHPKLPTDWAAPFLSMG